MWLTTLVFRTANAKWLLISPEVLWNSNFKAKFLSKKLRWVLVFRMRARMDDAVHVEVQVVELHLVRVRLGRVDRGSNPVHIWRLKTKWKCCFLTEGKIVPYHPGNQEDLFGEEHQWWHYWTELDPAICEVYFFALSSRSRGPRGQCHLVGELWHNTSLG